MSIEVVTDQKDLEIARLKSEIKDLERLVDYLRRKRFASSSETLTAMRLLFETPAESESGETEPTPPKATRRERQTNQPRRATLSLDIPREPISHVIPEAERVCQCGHALHEIGAEVTEQLEYVPAKVVVKRHERMKYGCRGCGEKIVTAKMPKQPIPRSIASPSLLAHVATAKYCDGLPLYRQEDILGRIGVDLDRGTMASWMIKCGELVAPLVGRLVRRTRDRAIVHCDETPHQVLNEPGRRPQQKGFMWVTFSEAPGQRIVLYDYDPVKNTGVVERLFKGYKGTLVTDHFDGYSKFARETGATRAGCWAHVRRKFADAVKIAGGAAKSPIAAKAMLKIQSLYRVERAIAMRRARGEEADALAMRQKHSKWRIDRFRQFLDEKLATTPPKTPVGRALQYADNDWDALTVCLRDGDVPIDNNACENSIRPFVIGRKAWLFSASLQGARASAALYSIVVTARANGLEPEDYLERIFTELPNAVTDEDFERLLPFAPKH